MQRKRRTKRKIENSRNIVFCAYWNSINYLRMTRRNENAASTVRTHRPSQWVFHKTENARAVHFISVETEIEIERQKSWFLWWVWCACSRCLNANYFNFNQLHCVARARSRKKRPPFKRSIRSPSTLAAYTQCASRIIPTTTNDYCYYFTSSEMKSRIAHTKT